MKLRFQGYLTVVAALTLTSLGGAFAYQNLQQAEETKIEPPQRVYPRLAANGSEMFVKAFRIQSDLATPRTSQFTGTLQPRYQSLVGFRVAGKIVERNVELGQKVEPGQVLFRLDPMDFDLQLRMAESELVSAKALLQQATSEERRLSQLRKSTAVSQSDYDLAVSAKEVASARYDAADRRLRLSRNQREYCELVADQSGQITAIQAEVGQVVNLGQPVLQMMHGSSLEAVVPIPENLLDDAKNLYAIATFWSKPSLRVSAQLRELSPAANAVSRTFDARFQLDECNEELSIGMTVSIRLVHEKSNEIQVPIQAISSKGDQPIVWRIRIVPSGSLDSCAVESIPIRILRYNNDTASIQADLNEGDQIVSSGVQRIDDDCRVRIWKGQ